MYFNTNTPAQLESPASESLTIEWGMVVATGRRSFGLSFCAFPQLSITNTIINNKKTSLEDL